MKFLLFLLILLIFSLTGCDNNLDPFSVRIYSVSSVNVKAGDTLTIKGTNFGLNFDPCRKYVVFNSDNQKGYKLDNYEVVRWWFDEIVLIINKNAESGKMGVYCLGEFSNCIEITVQSNIP
jgi:hypothetical protein